MFDLVQERPPAPGQLGRGVGRVSIEQITAWTGISGAQVEEYLFEISPALTPDGRRLSSASRASLLVDGLPVPVTSSDPPTVPDPPDAVRKGSGRSLFSKVRSSRASRLGSTSRDADDHTDDHITLQVFALLFFQLRRSQDFEAELQRRCNNVAQKKVVLAAVLQPDQLDNKAEFLYAYYQGADGAGSDAGLVTSLYSTDNNDVWDTAAKEFDAAEMDQPMPHYFIKSSHNTYLEAGQFRGTSDAKMYSEAIADGYACVETDTYAQRDEIVIKHLTEKGAGSISFKESLQEMHDALAARRRRFSNRSSLSRQRTFAGPILHGAEVLSSADASQPDDVLPPVWISVEQHVKRGRQPHMARELQKQFGSTIADEKDVDVIKKATASATAAAGTQTSMFSIFSSVTGLLDLGFLTSSVFLSDFCATRLSMPIYVLF